MNSRQKFFLMHGVTVIFMLSATGTIHLIGGSVFVLAIAWAGMVFMNEYINVVTLEPITILIARLEGELKTHREYRKLMTIVDRALKTNRRR